jgi:hypothetical protein
MSLEQAVADGVNVNYDVYRIKTEITEPASRSMPATFWTSGTLHGVISALVVRNLFFTELG